VQHLPFACGERRSPRTVSLPKPHDLSNAGDPADGIPGPRCNWREHREASKRFAFRRLRCQQARPVGNAASIVGAPTFFFSGSPPRNRNPAGPQSTRLPQRRRRRSWPAMCILRVTQPPTSPATLGNDQPHWPLVASAGTAKPADVPQQAAPRLAGCADSRSQRWGLLHLWLSLTVALEGRRHSGPTAAAEGRVNARSWWR